MSKDPGFGVSQFMEGARYQHALETELARTISNLQAVEGARVHLALPRQSAFVRDRRPPSASVFLQMKPGRRLESEQVTAIVNLVASSIPELEAEQVTVVDQQGRLLSAPEGNDELAAREKQLEIARSMEERYTQRVEQLLAPLVGPGRVRAQVVADVELSTTEEAREQYRPESQIVRSEQTAEETSRNGAGPQGVPGALTNQPPTPGVALPPGVAAPRVRPRRPMRRRDDCAVAAGQHVQAGDAQLRNRSHRRLHASAGRSPEAPHGRGARRQPAHDRRRRQGHRNRADARAAREHDAPGQGRGRLRRGARRQRQRRQCVVQGRS